MGTKSEACHIAYNLLRKVKKHVSGKDVWQTRDQVPLCREGAPLMISEAFAVALLRMRIRMRCPIIQVPLPRVHNKTSSMRSMGSHFSSLLLNMQDCVRPFMADRMWDDQQS